MTLPYRLKLPDDVRWVVQRSHPALKRKIRAALEQILEDPTSGKALREELEGLRSFRVGKFRIIYRLSSRARAIEVVAIGPRRSIYEDTLRLVRREEGQ